MPARADDMPFDLRSLSIFLAVCDEGGMAPAARRLALTQPAVSLAVAELESRTGALLFDRAVRPIALTSSGALLRQRASALLSEARQIGPLLTEAARGRYPLVRLGLVDSLARTLGPSLAGALAERADEVAILSGLTASHASALLTRNLDLMIGVDDLEDMPGLARWPLFTETYVIVARRELRVPRRIEDFGAFARANRFVRFSARSRTGADVDRHLRRLELELPRGVEFDTPAGVTAMVAEGGGFAITTPLCLIEAGADFGVVRASPMPGPPLQRRLTLVAYRQQLGRLPQEIADLSRAVVAREVQPRMATVMPEVRGALRPIRA
jgi:DNA-binding transcriptional LysR family regulator